MNVLVQLADSNHAFFSRPLQVLFPVKGKESFVELFASLCSQSIRHLIVQTIGMSCHSMGKSLKGKKQLCFQACTGVATAVGFTRVEGTAVIAEHLKQVLETRTADTKMLLEMIPNKRSIGAGQILPDTRQSPLMMEDFLLLSWEGAVVPLPGLEKY